MVLNNYTPGPGQYQDSKIQIILKREPNSVFGKAGRSSSTSNLIPGRTLHSIQLEHTPMKPIKTVRGTKDSRLRADTLNFQPILPECPAREPITHQKQNCSNKKEPLLVSAKALKCKLSMSVKFLMLQVQRGTISLMEPLSRKAALFLAGRRELVWPRTPKTQGQAHTLSTISPPCLSFLFPSRIPVGSKEAPIPAQEHTNRE